MRRTKIGKFELNSKLNKTLSNPIILGLAVIVVVFLFAGVFKGASFIGAAVSDIIEDKEELLLQAAAYCPSGFYLPYNDDSGNEAGKSCCGNTVCEGAESTDSCPYDCQRTKVKVFKLDDLASKMEGKQIPQEYFPLFKQVVSSGGYQGLNQDFFFSVNMEDGSFVKYKIKMSESGNITSVERVN